MTAQTVAERWSSPTESHATGDGAYPNGTTLLSMS